MPDRGPNYAVERRRLELALAEHEDTIEKGQARLAEIERAKKRNIDRAELANLELDAEAERIEENEEALKVKMSEIAGNLKAMTKDGADAGKEGI
jgi:hypothetical protein